MVAPGGKFARMVTAQIVEDIGEYPGSSPDESVGRALRGVQQRLIDEDPEGYAAYVQRYVNRAETPEQKEKIRRMFYPYGGPLDD